MRGNIALNIYTNYLNQVAQTTIDFPRVELSLGAAVLSHPPGRCGNSTPIGRSKESYR